MVHPKSLELTVSTNYGFREPHSRRTMISRRASEKDSWCQAVRFRSSASDSALDKLANATPLAEPRLRLSRGNMKYLYALMDDSTRFWIAEEDAKFTADLRPLFQKGKRLAEKNPKALITDGAPNFHEAFVDEFYTTKLETRPEHIRDIRIDDRVHNNKMERMNGELRDRERVMRILVCYSVDITKTSV